MNKLKMTVLAALVSSASCFSSGIVMAADFDNDLQLDKAIKVLESFNKRASASARLSESDLQHIKTLVEAQSVDPYNLWNVVFSVGLSIDKYRDKLGSNPSDTKYIEVMKKMFKDIIGIAYPVVLSAKARTHIDKHLKVYYVDQEDEATYVLMNAIEIAQDELGFGIVGAVAGFSSAIGGLHALGTGISHWVAKDKQDRGLLLPEKVTLDYKVGDYIASKGAVKYVGTIVKDGIMIGTVTIRTSIPGPSTGFMRVSAKVKLSSMTYSYSKMQVQSKVEGPLQVTLMSKKAGVPILPLLFGGDKVAGKIAGYEFECSR